MAVVLIVGGLSLAYRDLRGTGAPHSANDPDSLSDPPNWKVESAGSSNSSRVRWRTNGGANSAPPTRYGVPTSAEPPLWVRRTDKVPAPAPTYLPKNQTIESPHITFLPTPVPARTASINRPPALAPLSKGAKPANTVKTVNIAETVKTESTVAVTTRAINSSTGAVADPVADEEHRVLLKHAKFLINAGLAPMAQEPLRQIIREAPGTPLAREARATLDTIRN
jgi:hypothetical protein